MTKTVRPNGQRWHGTSERVGDQPAVPSSRRRRVWPLLRWTVILAIWGALAGFGVLVWFAQDLPRPETALDAARRPGLSLQDRSGQTFATFGDVVGEPLRLADMPRWLPQAAVSVEDRRFYRHDGLDLIGIARAAFVNLRTGRLVQGGSTITQQVAKNLFLTNARTLRRKVQELMLTLWLEHSFSKAEILEIWLNRVYLGTGAWGVDAAARMYFGVSARRLNLWQSAVLAGLPRAPSRINPRVDPEAAAARGREVLAAMVETGASTKAEAESASAAIAFPPRPATASWFADWVAETSQTVVPQDADAVLHTTLDSRLQGVVEARLAALLDGPGAASGVGQGAVIVMDAATGAVRAMAGGRDYRTSSFNRAVAARRQPGSAFKPMVWLNALEHGMRPDDTVLDAPIRIGNWNPQNFDGTFHGEVTLEEALAQSLNTAAVRLVQSCGGPRAVAAVARRLGVTGALPDNLSLALGTGEVGLLELASAYAVLFNGGVAVTPTGIERVEADHRPLPLARETPARVVDPEIAGEMVRMMAAVVARGSGRAAAIPGRFVAGKTGTTQDYRDAWFIGEAGSTVVGVWLGNDDNTPMRGVSGSSLPARLFREIALALK
ncbi:MAG: PBP1A family penicillin-binding protein [Acetobacteraceae bacterium]|nr:PBP1A family penicillin-binding protein [Acetobacteraceae bacterium]